MSAKKAKPSTTKDEDMDRLRKVILRLDEHLQSTNSKLADVRTLIRTEKNVQARNLILKKSYAMVREQHTIQTILLDYKNKLKILENKNEMPDRYPRYFRNSKLHVLFKSNDSEPKNSDAETEDKPSVCLGKSTKTLDDQNNVDVKHIKTEINDGDDALTITAEPSSLKNNNVINATQSQERSKNIKLHELFDDKPVESQVSEDQVIMPKIKTEKLPTDLQDMKKQAENAVDDVENETQKPIDINNLSEALEYLRALQEYAMLNENYRAIGLLTETEKTLIHPPVDKDFEEEQ